MPQHVYFIASTGPRGSKPTVDAAGAPCKGRPPEADAPSIVQQVGLESSQYTIREIAEPDSLQECYAVVQSILREARQEFLGARYVADYTGGTKTMSVALAMAGLEADWELSLVKGARTDLVKVIDGTEVAGLVNSWEVRARQRMEEARRLFDSHHYAAAEALLSNILQTGAISTALQTSVREWIGLARGFDAWDRFDHARALTILTPYQSRIVPNFIFLKQIIGADKRTTGYEGTFDLLRNAERRAHQGRYDDAVARLYRACELLAQTRLQKRTPPLSSADLDVSLLPEELRPTYEHLRDPSDNRIKLGLRQDYELLTALGDPVGIAYQRVETALLNGLSARNNSILAHGSTSLSAPQYQAFAGIVTTLFNDACAQLQISVNAPQFPTLETSNGKDKVVP
jgi:hypothetical protein